jgi:LysM repeat protein
MSRSFISRSRNQNTNSNYSNELQKKIDPVAQMQWLNNQQMDGGWNTFDSNLVGNQPAQMFAQDEIKTKNRKDESIQKKSDNAVWPIERDMANMNKNVAQAKDNGEDLRNYSGNEVVQMHANGSDPTKHTIVEGDTYWDLAKNSNGLFTVEDLISWNSDIDWNNLKIGDQINKSPPETYKSFEEISTEIREGGFEIFMQYIENEKYGVDYFINNCRTFEFDSDGWLGEVIEMSPPTKDAFHIVAWRDALISDGTPETNALEHKIGVFLIGAKYGEEMAELIPTMNEVRGLIINDRQSGLMWEALMGSENTAFTWSDMKHNKEGLEIYTEWHKKQEAERISKIKRFSKEWWLEIAKRMPMD